MPVDYASPGMDFMKEDYLPQMEFLSEVPFKQFEEAAASVRENDFRHERFIEAVRANAGNGQLSYDEYLVGANGEPIKMITLHYLRGWNKKNVLKTRVIVFSAHEQNDGLIDAWVTFVDVQALRVKDPIRVLYNPFDPKQSTKVNIPRLSH